MEATIICIILIGVGVGLALLVNDIRKHPDAYILQHPFPVSKAQRERELATEQREASYYQTSEWTPVIAERLRQVKPLVLALAVAGLLLTQSAPAKSAVLNNEVHVGNYYTVTLVRDNGAIFQTTMPAPRVLLRMVAPNRNYVQCRSAIVVFDNAAIDYQAAAAAFMAASLISLGTFDALVAAGTLVQFATGIGMGGAAGYVMGLYYRENVADAAMRAACG